MHRHCRSAVGGAVFALIAALFAVPAAAGVLTTSIDLDYTYSQENLAGDVSATTKYFQKYEVKYETGLTSSLDFLGAVKLEIDDSWQETEAASSRVSPNLELQVKGPQASVKFSYSGVISSTEEFREVAESKSYSNSADFDVELVPEYWPELKFRFQDRRDYEQQQVDNTARLGELQLRDDIFNVRLEFNLKREQQRDILPERGLTDTTVWSWAATYKEVLFAETEFELDYEINESYAETSRRGVFVSADETYTQQVRARLKKSLDLSARLNVGFSWEYAAEQDLLQLEFDYTVANKYQLDLRYDPFSSLKISGAAKRETRLEAGAEGEEDLREVTDSLNGTFDYQPLEWLRLGGKGEWKSKSAIAEATGGSVDRTDDQDYELIAKAKLGENLDLGLDGTYSQTNENGWLVSRETKLKADGKFKMGEFSVESSYEALRGVTWDDGIDDPSTQKGTHEAKLRIGYRLQLADLITATFTHEYGLKISRELDEVLEYSRERSLTENTRFNLVVADLFEGLRLEGEIERSGADTEGDADPQIVAIAYSLKLDWKFETVSLAAGLKYSDKGDEFDDLNFTSKVTWTIDAVDLSGGYEFTKIYADETDEDRKLNLKLTYKF